MFMEISTDENRNLNLLQLERFTAVNFEGETCLLGGFKGCGN